jgi:ArsR family transcriptional regulator, nickel/cobalt-responsive transcriptional repressor
VVCVGHQTSGADAVSQLNHETAKLVATTLQALAAPSRLLILATLTAGPRTVGDLAEMVEMEQSAVSHQLRLLRHLGLVDSERQGRHIVYSLYDTHVAELIEQATYHTEHLRLGLRDRPRAVV